MIGKTSLRPINCQRKMGERRKARLGLKNLILEMSIGQPNSMNHKNNERGKETMCEQLLQRKSW